MEAPASLAAQAPAPEQADATLALSVEDEVTKLEKSAPVDTADTTDADTLDTASAAGVAGEAGDGALAGAAEGAADGLLEGAAESAGAGAGPDELKGAGAEAGNGITLPLWQLQVALAALAVAAIGAWAGLTRIRRD